jgi:hypothetical protein
MRYRSASGGGASRGIIVVGIYNTANRIYDYTPTLIKNEFVDNRAVT